MWQAKQTGILFGSDAQINSLLTFVLGPSFVWSTTDVCPQCLRRHFSFKLGSTFWRAKIQISIMKNSAVSEMLEMWKMKNVTLFSLDEQQSNGPFYLLLSGRFTTFAPAGIYAIAPNRQIYIQIVLMKFGSNDPNLRSSPMFDLQKELVHLLSEGWQTRRRRGEGLRDLTAASSLSQDVPRNLRLLLVITSNYQSTSLTKKTFH